jgi:hypothetical protein
VKFPAFLKPHDGGGWRDVHHVHNPDEFFRAYDSTRDLCMTLQAAVNFNEYFRCYVVGQQDVQIMPYDPRRPHHERYVMDPPEYSKELLARVEKDALTLCRALGYDLNTVEFAVEDGVPYAIDFMNPAPDADVHSVGQKNFDWIVDKVAKLAVERAKISGAPPKELKWSSFLMGSTTTPVVGISKTSGLKRSSDRSDNESETKAPLRKNVAEKREVKEATKKRASKKSTM